jgi:hypothetical protein
MSVPAKQSWPRRAAFAGAVLATAVLAIGVMPRPAAAQYAYYYGYPAAGYYTYSYPAYNHFPLYAYPHYSYPFYGYLSGDGAWDSSRGDGDRAWRRGGRGHGG